MKIIRTIWLMALTIAFWPWVIILGVCWLIRCIEHAKELSKTIIDGLEFWWEDLKYVIGIGKNFIVNGLGGY